MKKAILIISILTIILLLTSCMTDTVTLPPETTASENNTPTPETTKATETPISEPIIDFKSLLYTVYVDPGMNEIDPEDTDNVVLDHNGNPITFVENHTPLYGPDDTIVLSSEKAPQASAHRTVELNGKEYKLNYDKTQKLRCAESHNKWFHKFGYIEYYTFSDEKVAINAEFNKSTGELVRWTYEVLKGNINGNFTVDEAKEKAKEYICSLYGNDVFNSYTFSDGSIRRNNIETISITYRRYVNGCGTQDSITVEFDLKGRIIAFNARDKGLFDFINTEIGAQKIQNAEAALRLAIPEGYEIKSESSLFFNEITQKYFFVVVVRPKVINDDIMPSADTYWFYINID